MVQASIKDQMILRGSGGFLIGHAWNIFGIEINIFSSCIFILMLVIFTIWMNQKIGYMRP